jgi:hypothetical protein
MGFGWAYGEEAPPDADTYEVWEEPGFPAGFPTGQDENYYYGVGLDGKHWKVPK